MAYIPWLLVGKRRPEFRVKFLIKSWISRKLEQTCPTSFRSEPITDRITRRNRVIRLFVHLGYPLEPGRLCWTRPESEISGYPRSSLEIRLHTSMRLLECVGYPDSRVESANFGQCRTDTRGLTRWIRQVDSSRVGLVRIESDQHAYV